MAEEDSDDEIKPLQKSTKNFEEFTIGGAMQRKFLSKAESTHAFRYSDSMVKTIDTVQKKGRT